MVDVKGLQRSLQSIFEALPLASMGALAMLQFAIQQFLGEPVVWHADYMACPAQLGLHQDGVDARQACPCEHICVRGPLLPLYIEKFLRLVMWK